MGTDAGSPAPSTLDVARSVADAAQAHEDVVDLDTGLAGEFATYGLDGRVPGVRVDRHGRRVQVRVRIVIRFGRPIPELADEVRSRVMAALGDLGVDADVHVHVADITENADAPAIDRSGVR